MKVTVPAGRGGGETMRVQTPNGQTEVVIPEGLRSEQTFHFQLPLDMQDLMHEVHWFLLLSYALYMSASLLRAIHFSQYRLNGFGEPVCDIFASCFEAVGYWIFVCVLLLVAQGWTILTPNVTNKVANVVFLSALGLLLIALYFGRILHDRALDASVYEVPSWQLVLLMSLKMSLMLAFNVLVWRSRRKAELDSDYEDTRKLYIRIQAMYTLWFLTAPIFWMIAWILHPYSRSIILFASEQLIQLLAFLTWVEWIEVRPTNSSRVLPSEVNDDVNNFADAVPAGSEPLIPASSGPLNYVERHGIQILVHQIYARWDSNRDWEAWWSAVQRGNSQRASDEHHVSQNSRCPLQQSFITNGCYVSILEASSEDCTQWARVFVQITPGGPLNVDGKSVGFALCAVRPGRAAADGLFRGNGRPELAGCPALSAGDEGVWCRAVDTDSDEVFYYQTATLDVSTEIPQQYNYDLDVTFKSRRRWRDYSTEVAVRFSRRVVFIKILPCFARFSQQMGSLIQNEFWGFENGEKSDQTVTMVFWAESEKQAMAIVRKVNDSRSQDLKGSDFINDSKALQVAEALSGPNSGSAETAMAEFSVAADRHVENPEFSHPLNRPVAPIEPSDADHDESRRSGNSGRMNNFSQELEVNRSMWGADQMPDLPGEDPQGVRAQRGAARDMGLFATGLSEREWSRAGNSSGTGHSQVSGQPQSDDIEAGVSYDRQNTVLSQAARNILSSH